MSFLNLKFGSESNDFSPGVSGKGLVCAQRPVRKVTEIALLEAAWQRLLPKGHFFIDKLRHIRTKGEKYGTVPAKNDHFCQSAMEKNSLQFFSVKV